MPTHRFVTTHFSLLADAQETESSELLEFVHSLIPNFTAPFNTIVLAGDFNVPPHAPVLQKIQNNNLWPGNTEIAIEHESEHGRGEQRKKREKKESKNKQAHALLLFSAQCMGNMWL